MNASALASASAPHRLRTEATREEVVQLDERRHRDDSRLPSGREQLSTCHVAFVSFIDRREPNESRRQSVADPPVAARSAAAWPTQWRAPLRLPVPWVLVMWPRGMPPRVCVDTDHERLGIRD